MDGEPAGPDAREGVRPFVKDDGAPRPKNPILGWGLPICGVVAAFRELFHREFGPRGGFLVRGMVLGHNGPFRDLNTLACLSGGACCPKSIDFPPHKDAEGRRLLADGLSAYIFLGSRFLFSALPVSLSGSSPAFR